MRVAPRNSWLAINLAATIFVSAFLLFQIQPLLSKHILPWFGGTPAVWTTCMLFFQTLLFGGYAYAHVSSQWLRPKHQALVQMALIALALLLLPVLPGEGWKPEDSTNPAGKILLLLTVSVGLPYFVLSSTGPLIQAWFARAFPGRMPYRLYALSNVGSLLALLSYPFFLERLFTVRGQATFWSWGFIVYAALCGYAAVSLWMLLREDKSGQSAVGSEQERAGSRSSRSPAPRRRHYLLWMALPAVASVTFLATTNHVCSDVAVIPFLWVVPLSLYLITFIIAFDHPRWYRPALIAAITLVAIYGVAMLDTRHPGEKIQLYQCGTIGDMAHGILGAVAKWNDGAGAKAPDSPEFSVKFPWYLALSFTAMFGISMLCHGELVRLRPAPKYLTAFYLMIAAGGALGGVAVAMIAPQVFVTFFEWNLTLFIGYLLAAGLLFRAIGRLVYAGWRRLSPTNLLWIVPTVAIPILWIAGVGLRDLHKYLRTSDEGVQLRMRNFFGTLTIEEELPKDEWRRHLVLDHGRVTHGLQLTHPQRRQIPTTYYSVASGAGRTIGYFQQSAQDRGIHIGAVGLGTGTLAAYVRHEADSIRFYEINPQVREIATSGKWFTFLHDCEQRHGRWEVVLGDARLSLERELKKDQAQHFHVLVLDAFSGDAIPVHLLTREACQIYVDQLATAKADGEDGAIAVNISNRYLDLEPVVLALADNFGLGHVYVLNRGGDDEQYAAKWIILTRNKALIDALQEYAAPSPEERTPKARVKPPILWTDAYSNLVDVLK